MRHFISLLIAIFLFSCGAENTKNENNSATKNPDGIVSLDFEKSNINKEEEVDLNMDISRLSLSDIRILRNSFAAKQGYCFMKADLRGYFSTTDWYNKRMEDRYWKEESGEDIEPISYTKEEQEFIDKLKKREEEYKAQNFYLDGDRTLANMNNIVNFFQFEELDPSLTGMLGKNGFAIVPNDNIQLFHVYEKNDYNQFPNFVTTDMYMQLLHMYFGSLALRRLLNDFFETLDISALQKI
jgi:hypothetical protein